MILKELLERSEYTLVQGSEDVEISTLVYDSRKIEKGSVFVCISGAAFDGHKFAAQAAELGAAAIVVEKDVEVPESLTVIKFDNTRLALAEMSAAYFGYPAEELTTIGGITGTKGKTTTTYMIRAVLEHAGQKTGLIGTIETIIGDEKFHPSIQHQNLTSYRNLSVRWQMQVLKML